jgi:hypothetical protein
MTRVLHSVRHIKPGIAEPDHIDEIATQRKKRAINCARHN